MQVQGCLPGVGEHGSGGAGAAGGPMAHLLEQNYLILNQYKQNMQQYKVHENTELLVRWAPPPRPPAAPPPPPPPQNLQRYKVQQTMELLVRRLLPCIHAHMILRSPDSL